MPFPHSYLGASKGIWAEGNEEKEQERGRDSEKGRLREKGPDESIKTHPFNGLLDSHGKRFEVLRNVINFLKK